ncbi:Hypothetical protein FSTVST1_257 [Faustovirus ST1]|nr:Hypothetical protein FSTVST1_257 [Faustovirus ST1]
MESLHTSQFDNLLISNHIQKAYSLKLVKEYPDIVQIEDDKVMIRYMPQGPKFYVDILNDKNNDKIIHSDAIYQFYSDPRSLMPEQGDVFDADMLTSALHVVSMSLILLLECCEVVIQPLSKHVCGNCETTHSHITLTTQLSPTPIPHPSTCSSCVKTTKVLCRQCHESVVEENDKLMTDLMAKHYPEEPITDIKISLSDPKDRFIEFIKHHCGHYNKHTIEFNVEPTLDYEN